MFSQSSVSQKKFSASGRILGARSSGEAGALLGKTRKVNQGERVGELAS